MNLESALLLPPLPPGPIVVAVSGGADSTALLLLLQDALHHAGHLTRNPLIVAHLHHGIRGAAADADAAFTQALANHLGLPFFLDHANTPAVAQQTQSSLEMAARSLRRKFLTQTAFQNHCIAIATGHTADDQIETLFLRLSRGTSLRGLGGIQPFPPVPFPTHPPTSPETIPWLRPLLNLRHQTLCDYLKARHQPWQEDATNQEDFALRNRIRHHLIPALEKALPPQTIPNTLRSQALLREDEAYLNSLANNAFKACFSPPNALQIPALLALPTPLLRRVLVAWLSSLNFPFPHLSLETLTHIQIFCSTPITDSHPKTSALGGQWSLHRQKNLLSLVPPGASHSVSSRQHDLTPIPITLPSVPTTWGPFNFSPHLPPLTLHCTTGPLLRPARSASPLQFPLSCSLSLNTAGHTFYLRSALPGDRITCAGTKPITQKISDIFTNWKVPRHLRANVPLLAETAHEPGEILWIPGFAIHQRFAVEPSQLSLQLTLVSHHESR